MILELNKVLKGVFAVIGCAVLMAILYFILFGGKAIDFQGKTYSAGSDWEGVLFYASRQIEHPISKYYYSYCYLPSIHMEDSVDSSLGGIHIASIENINKTKSDLSSDTFDNVFFIKPIYSHWSTGWK